MNENNPDVLVLEVSKSELFDMVTAMIVRAERFISLRAPLVLIDQIVDRAEKFNKILKESGYNHWTKEKFIDLKEKARYEGIQ